MSLSFTRGAGFKASQPHNFFWLVASTNQGPGLTYSMNLAIDEKTKRKVEHSIEQQPKLAKLKMIFTSFKL